MPDTFLLDLANISLAVVVSGCSLALALAVIHDLIGSARRKSRAFR